MRKNLKISFTIIGAIIGAGFASGKEIYLFFTKYGNKGIIGIIISFTILGTIIYKVIKIASNKKIEKYENFLEAIGSKNNTIKIIINTFLLITYYIMISAFSAYFKQELNIHPIIGAITISLLCYITLNQNIEGITKANTILIPIITIAIIAFGIKNISPKQTPIAQNTSTIHCIISSILYTSYNSITLIPVIITIKDQIKNKKQNITITLIVIITLIALAISIHISITKIGNNINQIELPTIHIASKQGAIYKYIYGGIILTSIYTTAVTTLYSFLKNNTKTNKKYKKLNILINTSSLIISNISFTALLNKVYPIFGILGLIQIFRIFAITLEKNPQN